MKKRAFLCSYGSAVAELPKRKRTHDNVLACLKENPRISTFDMSGQYKWLPGIIEDLERLGKIKAVPCEYPWHKWKVTT